MDRHIANQLSSNAFVGTFDNKTIDANTVAILITQQDFAVVPRPLLPVVYIVVVNDDVSAQDAGQAAREPKVKYVHLDGRNFSTANRATVERLVRQAQEEHLLMAQLKARLRELRSVIKETSVRSIDDLVSACKGYDARTEQLGRRANQAREPQVYLPVPGSAIPWPSQCREQLAESKITVIAHDHMAFGSMPLRLEFPDAQGNYNDAGQGLNDYQRNARVIRLVANNSDKADELRRDHNHSRVTKQRAYAILPPEPERNQGYALAVLDGLDQLNYSRYLLDMEPLPPGAAAKSFASLFSDVQHVLQQMQDLEQAEA